MSVSKALPIGLTSCDLISQRRVAHRTPGGVRLTNELWSINISTPLGWWELLPLLTQSLTPWSSLHLFQKRY